MNINRVWPFSIVTVFLWALLTTETVDFGIFIPKAYATKNRNRELKEHFYSKRKKLQMEKKKGKNFLLKK